MGAAINSPAATVQQPGCVLVPGWWAWLTMRDDAIHAGGWDHMELNAAASRLSVTVKMPYLVLGAGWWV